MICLLLFVSLFLVGMICEDTFLENAFFFVIYTTDYFPVKSVAVPQHAIIAWTLHPTSLDDL